MASLVFPKSSMAKKSLTKKVGKQRGQGMSEYIIIVALIAVTSIGVFSAFGKVIREQVAGLAAEMAGKDGSAALTAAGTAATDAKTKADADRKMNDYGAGNPH